MRYLEETKFDVVFTDPVIPCGQIVAEHLSVPSVYFLRGIPCGIDFEATQCPNPPSYVPRVFTEHTDHMSFLQRVKNLVFDVQNFFLCDFMYQPYTKLASEFLQRDVTVLDLLRKASVWLLRLDFNPQIPFCGAVLQPLIPWSIHTARVALSQVRIWHLLLLNFMWLVIAQLSNLSRSLCKASPPSRETTAPLNLMSSANFVCI
uniref:Uncharacterized protein n=1 Tax=Anser brachyrhynchus TaxID=132585 RepID=A0A8B9CGD6_9AVES